MIALIIPLKPQNCGARYRQFEGARAEEKYSLRATISDRSFQRLQYTIKCKKKCRALVLIWMYDVCKIHLCFWCCYFGSLSHYLANNEGAPQKARAHTGVPSHMSKQICFAICAQRKRLKQLTSRSQATAAATVDDMRR